MSKGTIIGLECHLALNKLNTKLFCSCKQPSPDSKPNTKTCEICLGLPGSKPVLNKKALQHALKLAIALNCKIAKEMVFSRKVYFYPDMPKNYQITQYEIPLGENGYIYLDSGKKIRITRIHLEEDPGALIHPSGSIQTSQYTLVDYNRAGIPLVEVVTEPDLESPEEAREFLKKLISIVSYLDIYDPELSTLKADVNISIKGGQRVEIKNVSGFKEVEKALIYEEARQEKELPDKQHTRAWDSNKTTFLRSKEQEADYGYIVDPDLTKIEITKDMIEKTKEAVPELAKEKTQRFIKQYKLSPVDAQVLSQEMKLANLFEKTAQKISPLLAAKWLRRELPRVMTYNKISFEELKIDETHLIDLLTLVEKKKITETTAQKILEKLIEKPFDVNKYVEKEKLTTTSSEGDLKKICKEAIKENPDAVKDYKNGEEKALHFITGQVMRKTRGTADPATVRKVLLKLLM